MKKNKISKNWLVKQNRDPFFRQSKIQGYRSRSAFKLIEMNKKFKFIKKNSSLLDLGSCPGGWSQVARKEIIKGKILAVDVKPMEKINNVDFINGDFSDDNVSKEIMLYFDNKIDVVLSDMAVNTSGNKALDSYRTGELCINAMSLAKKLLVQELLQNECSVELVTKQVLTLANKHSNNIDFDCVINQLGDGSAYKQTANFLLSK